MLVLSPLDFVQKIEEEINTFLIFRTDRVREFTHNGSSQTPYKKLNKHPIEQANTSVFSFVLRQNVTVSGCYSVMIVLNIVDNQLFVLQNVTVSGSCSVITVLNPSTNS